MINTLPKAQLILGYKEVFKRDPPADRLSLVAHICKRNLITELAALNYRLKPKTSKYQDTSLSTQADELRYFCGGNDNLLRFYSKIASFYTKDKSNYPLIFTRQTCLFGIEEVLASNLEVIDDFSMTSSGDWESLLKFIFAINTEITNIDEEGENEPVSFETLNPKLIPLNELSLDTDPFNIPFRGYKLMEYLQNHHELSEHLTAYLDKTYGVSFDYLVYETLGMYLANKHEVSQFDFYYNVKPTAIKLFEILSQRLETSDIPKLLGIRKYPFYKSSKYEFILIDNILLLEKLYSQFINDFWFDYIKPIADWNIKKYRAVIGYFFESYVREIINHSFSNTKHYVVRQFDELIINFKGNKIEVADLYIRYNSKIILGQVKSTSIYDNEKYGGNIDILYKNDRNKFFETFGVNQVVQSISILNETMSALDNKFPFNKSLQLFPIIIFNEKALQTPLMAEIFQNRFLELMKDFKSNKIQIHPLSLIHVGDLETIQDLLHENPNKIWEMIKYHYRHPKFMPPFYNSINRLDIRPNYQRTMSLYEELVPKFSEK